MSRSSTFRKRFVLLAAGHLLGVKSGSAIGIRLNIAASAVEVKEHGFAKTMKKRVHENSYRMV